MSVAMARYPLHRRFAIPSFLRLLTAEQRLPALARNFFSSRIAGPPRAFLWNPSLPLSVRTFRRGVDAAFRPQMKPRQQGHAAI